MAPAELHGALRGEDEALILAEANKLASQGGTARAARDVRARLEKAGAAPHPLLCRAAALVHVACAAALTPAARRPPLGAAAAALLAGLETSPKCEALHVLSVRVAFLRASALLEAAGGEPPLSAEQRQAFEVARDAAARALSLAPLQPPSAWLQAELRVAARGGSTEEIMNRRALSPARVI